MLFRSQTAEKIADCAKRHGFNSLVFEENLQKTRPSDESSIIIYYCEVLIDCDIVMENNLFDYEIIY